MCTYLKQQPVDLFTYFLDVWIHDLSSVESRCCKDIFIHRTPETHTDHRHLVCSKWLVISDHLLLVISYSNILLLMTNKTLTDTSHWVYSHTNFVPANDKGDLATPGVNKAGPAGVDGDIFTVSCTETDRGVVKRLTSILQDCCEQKVKSQWDNKLGNINLFCRSGKW